MAKTKISEFSATPANNTDIDSINIAEGCAPSGINDAIRELMAQLKDWQAGTSNDPMVIGTTGSLTLNQGTANGVTYLNGSKVLTSGSALTFDGTNFATSGTSTASKLIPTGTSVTGNGMYLPATNSLGFSTAGVNAVYIDANQNVGIGITPSAWRSAYNVTYGERALEVTYSALVTQAGPSTILANNVYFNSSNQWIYKNAVANTNAGLYTIGSNGVHSWSVAPTGASGAVATFTQAMTLDASGNLGIGTTSPTTLVDLVRSSTSGSDATMPNLFVRNTSATQGNGSSTFNQSIVKVDAGNGTVVGGIRAAYDSAGSYGTGMQLYVNSTNPLQFFTNNTERARITSDGSLILNNVGGDANMYFGGSSGTNRMYLARSGVNSLLVNVETSGALIFGTNGSERGRFDSSGNLLVASTNSSMTTGTGIKLTAAGGGASTPTLGLVGNSSDNGQGSYHLYSSSLSQYQFYVTYGGTIYARSTSITGLSDISEKENIRDLETGLNTVLALQPRRFDWKNGSGTNVSGFIAQEVQSVLPDLVESYKISDEENKLGLKMGDMIPTLVKAIQEQQALITQLQADIATLKG